jgi:undecaprenyl-phosphate 4-deoxy-4-formamido-L-arabinose transferase
MNRLRERITHIRMTDQAACCAPTTAHHRRDPRLARGAPYPGARLLLRAHPTEVESSTRSASAGESKYSLYKLVRLNFDIVTGFGPAAAAFCSSILVACSALRRVIIQRIVSGQGDWLYVIWDRDILEFFLIGVLLFGLGIIGEYVGRIYQQVRERPRYLIQAILEKRD